MDFRHIVKSIANLVSQTNLPVCVKETGCGISAADARMLKDAGVRYVETAGAGGTSWVGVETLRASGAQAEMGEILWDWGIPTAVSTVWCANAGLDVVAGGGIRTGLDVARALGLGAKMAGIAAPLVSRLIVEETAEVETYLRGIINTLRAVMLLVGVTTPVDLMNVPKVIGPDLQAYIQASLTR